MPPGVFCAKSAEVDERKGVALRSGAKERAEGALQKAGGQAKESEEQEGLVGASGRGPWRRVAWIWVTVQYRCWIYSGRAVEKRRKSNNEADGGVLRR